MFVQNVHTRGSFLAWNASPHVSQLKSSPREVKRDVAHEVVLACLNTSSVGTDAA